MRRSIQSDDLPDLAIPQSGRKAQPQDLAVAVIEFGQVGEQPAPLVAVHDEALGRVHPEVFEQFGGVERGGWPSSAALIGHRVAGDGEQPAANALRLADGRQFSERTLKDGGRQIFGNVRIPDAKPDEAVHGWEQLTVERRDPHRDIVCEGRLADGRPGSRRRYRAGVCLGAGLAGFGGRGRRRGGQRRVAHSPERADDLTHRRSPLAPVGQPGGQSVGQDSGHG